MLNSEIQDIRNEEKSLLLQLSEYKEKEKECNYVRQLRNEINKYKTVIEKTNKAFQEYSIEIIKIKSILGQTVIENDNVSITTDEEITVHTNDIYVYANYEVITYNISYILNGGEVESNPTSYTVESENITLNNPIREGYTFVGWNTKSDGTGTQYRTGDKVIINENMTLYAKWQKSEYTLAYDSNISKAKVLYVSIYGGIKEHHVSPRAQAQRHIEYLNNQEEFTVDRWIEMEDSTYMNEVMNIAEDYDLVIINSYVWVSSNVGITQAKLLEISKVTNIITIGNDERNASLVQKSTTPLNNVKIEATITNEGRNIIKSAIGEKNLNVIEKVTASDSYCASAVYRDNVTKLYKATYTDSSTGAKVSEGDAIGYVQTGGHIWMNAQIVVDRKSVV